MESPINNRALQVPSPVMESPINKRALQAPSPVGVDARFSPTKDYSKLFPDFLALFNFQIKKNCLEKIYLLVSKLPNRFNPVSQKHARYEAEIFIDYFSRYHEHNNDLQSKLNFVLFINYITKFPELKNTFVDTRKKAIFLSILRGGPITDSIHAYSPGEQSIITSIMNREILISILSTKNADLLSLMALNDSQPEVHKACSTQIPLLKQDIIHILNFLAANMIQIQLEISLVNTAIECLIDKIQSTEMSYSFEVFEEVTTDFPVDVTYDLPEDFAYLEDNIQKFIEMKNEMLEYFKPLTPSTPKVLENPFAIDDYDYFIDLEETIQTIYKLRVQFKDFSWDISGEFEHLMVIQFILNHVKSRFMFEPEAIMGPTPGF